ncbi:ankyrin repeat domain-containing protein 39 isoform X2 [Clarias gariepinus]|uniref:ankyrin repeat domain-containing protein 39 isoform X2 n=1 Tax=Clarias gariepinus TaxID=13013 RepID=UPI00234C04CF|nr:ankyrin repeat domain-containing protein 39 isoform X2 [Clarias gariepinus]
MATHGKQCSCGAHRSTPSVHQTLDEMDFERALDGDLERVRSLLQKGTDPNMKDQAGYTALHYASRAAHQSVCELLLDHGACANSQTHGGATALHRAAYCGHINVVKLLLNRGANPGLTDDDGSTPLHKAAEQGHLETCVVLVNRCPVLKTTKDKKSRLPVDLSPDHSTFSELLTPPR